MPVFNSEKYVAEAITSILTQTFTDFEFIIVDDGSTDATFEIIKSFFKKRFNIKSKRQEAFAKTNQPLPACPFNLIKKGGGWQR